MAILIFTNRAPKGTGTDYPEVGDVITVLPDGRSPGQKITVDAGFYQIRVPGDVARWTYLVEPVLETVDRGDGELITIATKFRKNTINIDSLTLLDKEQLDQKTLELGTEELEILVKEKEILLEEKKSG